MPDIHKFNCTSTCMSIKDQECSFEIIENKEKIYEKCTECPLECDSSSFSFFDSFADYPSPAYAEIIVKSDSLKRIFTNANYTILKRSVLSFSVYYSELKYTRMKQIPKMVLVDLISAIGGTLGLFIGGSIMSLIELLEAFISIFIAFINRNKIKA